MMDRELLIEIGVEELPASWMPGLTRQLAERLERAPHGVPHRAGRADRELQHAPAADRARRAHRRAAGRPRRNDHRPAGLGRVRQGRPADARRRSGFAKKQGVAFEQLTRAQTPKGEYLAFQKHAARAQRRRYAARHPQRRASRSGVPQADALGRDARRRAGRAALRPADPLAALSLRRPRRAVHDRALGSSGRTAGPGRRVRRADLRPPVSGDERPRRDVRSRSAASTSTRRG